MSWNKSDIIITPSQLLQRGTDPVYGLEARALIEDRTFLVTGAGGSIGSEVVRQLYKLRASTVYLVDRDEYALYRLQLDLTGTAMLDDPRFILADVSNAAEMNRIFAETKPYGVFHAAAHKHLPLLERSPSAGIVTNVLGTETIAAACVKHGVKRFVNVSTDKAANPTSVLGMTKRLAEMASANLAGSNTRIASVRFGNVLGSRGSFVETLSEQIARKRAITVTHPEVSRFFMSIPEAASLIIEAAVFAENGETYVLDMGEPVKILSLIRRYAELCGKEMPEVIFSGLRPGEKLHEELYDSSEVRRDTRHPRISAVNVDNTATPGDIHVLYALASGGCSSYELREKMAHTISNSELTLTSL